MWRSSGAIAGESVSMYDDFETKTSYTYLQTVVEALQEPICMPKPELLVATKLLSIGERDKRDKKVKDICDLFSLLWYGGETPAGIRLKVRQFLPDEAIKKGFSSITAEDFYNASIPLQHNVEEIRKVVSV